MNQNTTYFFIRQICKFLIFVNIVVYNFRRRKKGEGTLSFSLRRRYHKKIFCYLKVSGEGIKRINIFIVCVWHYESHNIFVLERKTPYPLLSISYTNYVQQYLQTIRIKNISERKMYVVLIHLKYYSRRT